MTFRIKLSLAGDGRLVILTPQTVRKAFFLFSNANAQYTAKEKYQLDYPLHDPNTEIEKFSKKTQRQRQTGWWYFQSKKEVSHYGKATINDALHRANSLDYPDGEVGLLYLHPQDIRKVERQINKYVIDYGYALVKDEGRLLTGSDICQEAGRNRKKVKYIRRYGMFFIIEPISRQAVIKMRDLDLFIQDAKTFDFHLVRYYGILLSSLKSKIKLLFSHRLDFSKKWTWTVEQFKPRQIFRIVNIYPCPDFFILNKPSLNNK